MLPDNFESNTTILLYQSGLSGEFLGWALSCCLEDHSAGEQHWEGQTRCKYTDPLGRTLQDGSGIGVLKCKIDERLHLYNLNKTRSGSKHITLAHPDAEYIQFILKFLREAPVIEIVSRTHTSQHWQYIARSSKIKQIDLDQSTKSHSSTYEIQPYTKMYQAPNHLEIEWADLFLNDSNKVIASIAEFLNNNIDVQKISAMIDNYKQRNNSLINRCTV